MAFRENYLKKIEIDDLHRALRKSVGTPDSGKRIDLEQMRSLIEMGSYARQEIRDLEIYVMNPERTPPELLVLDNELKIYRTSIEDVALRKSPTVKEMVSIRNAIKILNDKDVVISRKADTLDRIHAELIAALDLSVNRSDIQALVDDGATALENQYTDGIVETALLFAELLGWVRAPKPYKANHHHIWGELGKDDPMRFGPAMAVNLMRNEIKMITAAVSRSDKAAMEAYHAILKGEAEPEVAGRAVWETLAQRVLETLPS